MKKFLKVIRNTIMVLCSLALVGSASVFFYHRVQLSKESELLKGKGTLVKVNNQRLNVYREGSGEHTYVFFPGSGVAAPIYEMKGLYSKFTKDNQVAVVERAGYGYSDQFNDKREMDAILDQTRNALIQSGLKPPYMLVPHSIAGVEAIYWAQKYPSEVKGIIALDIGLPQEYVDHEMKLTDKLVVRGMNVLSELGFARLFPTAAYDPEVIEQDFLTKQEKEIFKAISFKQFFNDNMMDELLQISNNAKKSVNIEVPYETPILFISAYTDENKDSKFTEQKNKNYHDMAKRLQKSEVVNVKGKHSIYLYAPEEIYLQAMKFMK